MMRRRMLPVAAALAVGLTGLVAAGCGDDEETAGSAQPAVAAQKEGSGADAPTESGAAQLRAGLTALLQEHVYLAGTAIATGVSEGLDSKAFEAAAGQLDENSKGLAEAIGGVYGDDAGKQFLALWRDHIGMFVDYTKAQVTNDDAAAREAKEELDGYRAEFGAFLASANPQLTEEAVAEELRPHVQSVESTIRAVATGSPKVYERLREAAGHMPGTANVLAGAIAQQFPDRFGG